MKRFLPAKLTSRQRVIIMTLTVLLLALAFVSRFFRSYLPTVEKHQTQVEIAKKHKEEDRLKSDAIREVTIVSPTSVEPIGSEVNVIIRVRTRKATLTNLAVRLGPQNTRWPGSWIVLANGVLPEPERTYVDRFGVTTTVYRWIWNSVPESNGNYVVHTESKFSINGNRDDESFIVDQGFKVLNLVVDDCDPSSTVLWKGEMGTKRPVSVTIKDNDLRSGTLKLALRLFSTESETIDRNKPIRVLTSNVVNMDGQSRSLKWKFEWDGQDNENAYVRPGVYTYEVAALQESEKDEVYSASGYFEDGKIKPYLTVIRAKTSDGQAVYNAEYAGENDNGTRTNPEDDFYEFFVSYRLLDVMGVGATKGRIRLINPKLEEMRRWSIADLICRAHDGSHDGLAASKWGVQHSVLVRVPKYLMPPTGAYRFVLDFKDDHARRYRDQQNRWSLPITVFAPRYRMEGIQTGQFRVAWCRAEAINDILKRTLDVGCAQGIIRGGQLVGKANPGIEGAPRRWVMDTPHRVLLVKRGTKELRPEIFGTEAGEIRAAVNGGLIGLPIMQPVGDIGVNGDWRYFLPTERANLWSFSMASSGGGFASAEVERSPRYSQLAKQKLTNVYHTPKSVMDAYPYGRGAVGLLVKDGKAIEPPPWWPPVVPGAPVSVDLPMQRTAIAFSDDVGDGKRHFFLVCASSCTWSMMAKFLAMDGGLETSMNRMLGRRNGYPIRLTISRAFMLDGGTSTQFAYRVTDSSGESVKYPGKTSENRDILLARHNRCITDIVAVKAACDDLGNHPVRVD